MPGAVLAAASIAIVACDNGPTSAEDGAVITVGFSAAGSAGASSSINGSVVPASTTTALGDVVVSGDNGTLTITDVHFIVSEFELERVDASCGEVEGEAEDDDACEKLETGPTFVGLPLDGATVPVVTEAVPAGTYASVKFEVQDADLGEAEDEQDRAAITALIEAIHAAGFTDWPGAASMVVVGSFTPAGGEPHEFTVYFDAEIEVELEFDPALVIEGEAGTVDIEVDPMAWFTNPDGSVIDLSAFDYATTGAVVEFEAELEHGFTKIELDDSDD